MACTQTFTLYTVHCLFYPMIFPKSPHNHSDIELTLRLGQLFRFSVNVVLAVLTVILFLLSLCLSVFLSNCLLLWNISKPTTVLNIVTSAIFAVCIGLPPLLPRLPIVAC